MSAITLEDGTVVETVETSDVLHRVAFDNFDRITKVIAVRITSPDGSVREEHHGMVHDANNNLVRMVSL